MEDNYDRELHERKSMNLLWVGIISIIMIFAGLTSAYLVLSTDNFWVEIEPPTWFYISTAVIVSSSLTFYLSIRAAKANNKKMIKVLMSITLILGILFTYTQFKGWSELTRKGYFFVGPIKAPGTYGENIIVFKDGVPFEFNGVDYLVQGEIISDSQHEELMNYCEKIASVDPRKKNYSLEEFKDYSISIFYFDTARFEPFTYSEGVLANTDPMGKRHEINNVQAITLRKFAQNFVEGRGYFYMNGEYGEDYVVKYRDKKLDYIDGKLYVGKNELSEEEYMNLEAAVNSSSSFVYLLSGLHLLHLLGGLIYVFVVFSGAIKEKYDSSNHLKIKLGSLYWHFLDLLWIYLFIFLTFIH